MNMADDTGLKREIEEEGQIKNRRVQNFLKVNLCGLLK